MGQSRPSVGVVQFLDFFLKGNLSLERHPRRKPHDWLPDQGWQDLMRLTELAAGKTAATGECVLQHQQIALLISHMPWSLGTAMSRQLSCTKPQAPGICMHNFPHKPACVVPVLSLHVCCGLQVAGTLCVRWLMTLWQTRPLGRPTTSVKHQSQHHCQMGSAPGSASLRCCCCCGACVLTESPLASPILSCTLWVKSMLHLQCWTTT